MALSWNAESPFIATKNPLFSESVVVFSTQEGKSIMKHTGYILKFVVAPCVAILLFALTLLAKPEPVQLAAVEISGGMALQPPAFLK